MTDPFEFAQKENAERSRDWHNCCAMFTRMAFGAPAIGDFDGDGSADAEDLWKAAKHKHPETDAKKIPRGVPVFWGGGSHDNGHAAVSRGDGTVWGTDLLRNGEVDVYRIDAVTEKWGLPLLGWTEDIGGVTVYEKPKPKPAKKAAAPKPAAQEEVSLANVRKASVVPDWVRVNIRKDVKEDVRLVKAALGKEGCTTYRQWQLKCGQVNPTGAIDKDSLVALGSKHAFKVVD